MLLGRWSRPGSPRCTGSAPNVPGPDLLGARGTWGLRGLVGRAGQGVASRPASAGRPGSLCSEELQARKLQETEVDLLGTKEPAAAFSPGNKPLPRPLRLPDKAAVWLSSMAGWRNRLATQKPPRLISQPGQSSWPGLIAVTMGQGPALSRDNGRREHRLGLTSRGEMGLGRYHLPRVSPRPLGL